MQLRSTFGQHLFFSQIRKRALFLTRSLLAGILFTGLMLPAHAESASTTGRGAAELTGVWLTESGNLEVEITPCGQAMCGTVVKVLANRSMNNPNGEVADAQPVLGLKILSDFTPAGDGELKGHIYNRENGKTYSCVLSLVSADQLKVHSYVGLRLFGKTQIWSRVPATAAQN
jgi:uncharacterized protein (DUF2147 family)